MKLVYVIGPYRAPTIHGIVENIRLAEALALQVWQSGAACICPHKNTALFDGTADDSVWLQGDLEILRRCDAVICTPDWQRSAGSRDEVALARKLGIPVFMTIEELQNWLDSVSGSTSAAGSVAAS